MRKVYYLPSDYWDTLSGQRKKYIPAKGDIYTGSGDFVAQGIHQVNLLKHYLDLQPSDYILDVGSGIGRTAIPLAQFINEQGHYEGFDVVEKGVDWCNKTIGNDFANFNFTYVPLHNNLYNNTKNSARDFVFPFQNEQFDSVFLFSVFTHMTFEEVQQYLSEICRVLKPGGDCLATFFIYNTMEEHKIATRKDFGFPIEKNGFRLMNEKVSSANIAFEEDTLDQLIKNSGLHKINQVDGHWKILKDKHRLNDFQDIVILKKN